MILLHAHPGRLISAFVFCLFFCVVVVFFFLFCFCVVAFLLSGSMKKVSECDQEVPQSQTADKPMAPRKKATQPSRDTRKTN